MNKIQKALARRCFSTGAVSSSVKVEFAFENARIRLHLPQWGETWFFVDRATTLGQFKELCKAEDSRVSQVQFVGKSALPDTELLFEKLTKGAGEQIYIKINDDLQSFPRTVDIHRDAPETKWYTKCTQEGLNPMHAATISTLVEHVDKEL